MEVRIFEFPIFNREMEKKIRIPFQILDFTSRIEMFESKSRDKITSTLGSINGTNRQVRPVKIVEEEFQLMNTPVQYSKNIFNGFDDSRLEQNGITVFSKKTELNSLFDQS